jgi:hypothetical protein
LSCDLPWAAARIDTVALILFNRTIPPGPNLFSAISIPIEDGFQVVNMEAESKSGLEIVQDTSKAYAQITF